MKVADLAVILVVFAGMTFRPGVTARSAIPHGICDFHQLLFAASSLPQTNKELEAPNRRCVEAAERLRRDSAAMVPGRTWTWELNAERSRSQIARLQEDLKAFWETETEFEGKLSPEQSSKLKSQFRAIRALFLHLQGDAQSLDLELQKGYPTRWHVAHDVSDMRSEINRWMKLHRHLAKNLGLGT
jgi:hypothetical protein